MVDVVHLSPQQYARRAGRVGVPGRSHGRAGGRGVYVMPVLSSYVATHQWVRELQRSQRGPLSAVDVRLPDDESVLVGHYATRPEELPAARAAALLRELPDPRGWEVFLPRSIAAREVRRVRAIGQGLGWRYVPDAHGQRPCTCDGCLPRGGYGTARLRRRFPLDAPRPTKPELMAALHSAQSPEQIVDALWALTGRRRGGAEELAHLLDHPDAQVRQTLADVLVWYRGPKVHEMRRELRRGRSRP
jgi:hypothetical protein